MKSVKQTLLVALLLVGTCAVAAPVSNSKAKKQASTFFNERGKSLNATTGHAKAPRRSNAKDESAYYYVFNADNGQGFVIISGDDRTPSVLGYSDSGSFESDDIPDNMQSWLQRYVDEIKSLPADESSETTSAAKTMRKAASTVAGSTVRKAVDPLVTAKWNQTAPYNQSCPMYTSGSNEYQSLAGCVATAVAQVMYYYKYPSKTIADLPYTWFDWDELKTVTVDKVAAGTAIDWDNMQDVVTTSSASEVRKAVADLMLYIGQSVKMDWGATSGAVFDSRVSSAMKTYFGYDDGTYMASHDDYTENQWIDLLYNEIYEGRPVTLAGSSTGGRHAFVLDGFDGDEYFHVNWGWGGNNNGYYLVSTLNPYDNTGAGAGSATDGYSMDEVALVGMKPADGIVADNEGTQMEVSSLSVSGSKITCKFKNRTDYNLSFSMGIAYVADDGTLKLIGSATTASVNSGSSKSLSFTVSGLAAGTYRIVPVSKVSSGSVYRTPFDVKNEYVNATVGSNGTVSLTYCTGSPSLSVTSIDVVGSLAANYKHEANVTFANTSGEYNGLIYLIVKSDALDSDITTYTQLTVNAERTVTKSFVFKPTAAGTYTLHISKSKTTSGDVATKTITIGSGSAATLTAATPVVENAQGTLCFGNFLKGHVTLSNTTTSAFNGKVQMVLWKATSSGTYYTTTKLTKDVSVSASGKTTVEYFFEDLDIGSTYGLGVAYGDRDNTYLNSKKLLISGLTLANGVIIYHRDGTISGQNGASRLKVPYDAVAVDHRGSTNITRVTPNSNPNTLYYLPPNKKYAKKDLAGRNIIENNCSDSIGINCDSAFFCPVAFTAKKITMKKRFSDTKKLWTGILFPFVPEKATANGVAYSCVSGASTAVYRLRIREFGSLGYDNTVNFDNISTLQTYTPYIISSTDNHGRSLAGDSILFTATDVTLAVSDANNVIAGSDAYNFYVTTTGNSLSSAYVISSDGTRFLPKTNAEVEPFGAYFVSKLKASKRTNAIIIEEVSTGVDNTTLHVNRETNAVYSLNGTKVGVAEISDGKIKLPALPSGIYVVAGKKIVVK